MNKYINSGYQIQICTEFPSKTQSPKFLSMS